MIIGKSLLLDDLDDDMTENEEIIVKTPLTAPLPKKTRHARFVEDDENMAKVMSDSSSTGESQPSSRDDQRGRHDWLLHGSHRARKLVNTRTFEGAVLVLMCATTVFAGVEASLPQAVLQEKQLLLRSLGSFMLLMFGVELGMRVCAYGLDFFKDVLNYLSWVVLLATIFFAIIWEDRAVPPLILIRWLGFGRGFDALKDVPHLNTIWLLLMGLQASMLTLAWSWVLAALTVMLFAVFAVQLIGRSSLWEDISDSDEHAVTMFRTVKDAVFAMTRFLFADGAADLMDELMERQQGVWIFFFVFQAVSVYVLLNLVTGVIVNNSLRIVQMDRENQLREEERLRAREARKLSDLFMRLDVNKNGRITLAEFTKGFDIPAFKHVMQVAGLEEDALKEFFHVLDLEADGSLSTSEFAQEMPKLFGSARAYDMLKAQKLSDKLEALLRRYLLTRMGVDPHGPELSKAEQAEVYSRRDFFLCKAKEEQKQVHEAITSLEQTVQMRLHSLNQYVANTWVLVGHAIQVASGALDVSPEDIVAGSEDASQPLHRPAEKRLS